jgi:hypothetical protein
MFSCVVACGDILVLKIYKFFLVILDSGIVFDNTNTQWTWKGLSILCVGPFIVHSLISLW